MKVLCVAALGPSWTVRQAVLRRQLSECQHHRPHLAWQQPAHACSPGKKLMAHRAVTGLRLEGGDYA
eukprot:6211050-Pleurochrysis_carterae.AAC.4